MNKKILAIGMLLILAAAIIWLGIFSKGNYKTLGSRGSSPVSNDAKNQSVANWVSQARTVDQLMVEADLVVKARVSEAPKTRIVRNEISMVDEKGAEIGKKVDEIAFSDTNFEVMEVYFGNASPNITVMQTGGFLNSPDERIEMQDDPLYNRGEEYILFLVNISGDPVQAPDRELYRIVNPSGRYRLEAGKIYSYAADQTTDQLPVTLDELEAQIMKNLRP